MSSFFTKYFRSDLHTRVHPFQSFSADHLQCFVKRDDDLGLIGSKSRKLKSLITHLVQQEIKEAVVVGSANSNHVLGLSQLLIEEKIRPQLFLRKPHQAQLKGNALLIQLLVSENLIRWVSAQQWHQVNELARVYANEQSHNKKVFLIPEGACIPEAFPGALSLPCDILQNEDQLGIQFDHFFVDSGSGLMAIALLLGLSSVNHPGHVHVILIAGSEDEFLKKLKVFHHLLTSLLGYECPWPSNFSFSKPCQARSFGATNREIFKIIKQIARDEGILCDPIYNAKLFLEAKRKIIEEKLHGKALIIQSGGTLSLLGFSLKF